MFLNAEKQTSFVRSPRYKAILLTTYGECERTTTLTLKLYTEVALLIVYAKEKRQKKKENLLDGFSFFSLFLDMDSN